MSSGFAIPDVTFVVPGIDFPPADVPTDLPADVPTADLPADVPATDLPADLPAADFPALDLPSVESVGSEVTEQLLDLLVPAALGLGALSGALLAGRAAMAGTQLLAAAALRAAEAQRERAEETNRARTSQRCWQDAAFAVCRANARIEALRARVRRARPPGGPGAGPGTGPDAPPLPDLPPTLDPVRMSLDRIRAWLAETDRAVRRVEAELARRALASPAAARDGRPDEQRDEQRDDRRAAAVARLRARRTRALAAYAEARTEREAGDALPPYAPPPQDARTLTADRVVEAGEQLLASLDPAVPAAACARIQEQLAHAAELAPERPADALLHLTEARDLVYAANWRAADRRETAEWAAQQLGFLRQPLPEPGPGPEPPELLATLERIVERGDPVDPRLRAEISVRVAARTAALERLYVAQLVRRQIAQRAGGSRVTVRRPAPGVELLEWAPPEWGTEHWLRLALDAEGTVRVQTVHRARDAREETAEARALDRERCREAGRRLARLLREAADAGVALDLVFDETATVAGTRPGPAGEADRRPEGCEAKIYRQLSHDGRDHDGPGGRHGGRRP
ncbi:hypothetical protein [Streptomyces sp. B6B3]|uniref:hypothetical protein n=1 Tax=Streptomyces sp. B6B3 TaxID=3153570 RepID=UPI00325F5CFE